MPWKLRRSTSCAPWMVGPPPTFGERAERGLIFWQEALTLARQWKREWDQSMQRDRLRIAEIVSCWGVV
ncbi:MAG: hypothetical protein JO287_16650, partial [Pseudonocardiales bacterium]|nr:hypothetical protein [Pseudonocardiales bacterium]